MELVELIHQLSAEEIEEARNMSPDDKFLLGARLFDRSCRIMLDGIRHQFPQASEREAYQILIQRLDMAEQLENQQ